MIGAILGFLLCISYIFTFYMGIVYSNKQSKIRKIKEITEEEEELAKEERIKARIRDEGFQNIMNYNVNTAMGKED